MTHDSLAIDYFLAAYRCESQQLSQLSQSCQLVKVVTCLIHELQKERGLSNIYLVSKGERFAEARQAQARQAQDAEQQLRHYLLGHRHDLRHKAAFYSRIAFALHELCVLPDLRSKIANFDACAAEATSALSQIISRLLLIVFEIADHSTCPETTRALVCFFHLLQCKEYAGQERAWGAMGFAAGHFEQETLEHLDALVHAQASCIELFLAQITDTHLLSWQEIECMSCLHELKKLRQMIKRIGTAQNVPESISEVWYEVSTQRIDAMQQFEHQLLCDLTALAQDKMKSAQQEMDSHCNSLDALLSLKADIEIPSSRFSDPHHLPETQFTTALFDLIQQQASRLQTLNSELITARQSLNDRKVIERAKGLLMQKHNISEEKAYQSLRRVAMNKNCSLATIANQTILILSESI